LKKVTIHLLLLALPLALAAGADPAGAEIFPYETHVETLDNGLRLIVVPMSSGGLATYWSIVRTGARDEYEPNRTGFAHFFEHMMFRGTEKYPSDLYNQKVTELGADANAFTSDDVTAYYLNVAAEDLETVMELESDRFRRLDYPEEMFRTEAGAVYGEYRKNRTNPFFTIYEAMRANAYEAHTYGHTAMGYEEDIKLMPTLYDYSRDFFDRYYRPENVVLLIVGDVEPEATFDLARKYYGDWEPGYRPPEVPEEPPQTEERRFEVDYQGQSLPILWAAYKADAFDPTDESFAATFLLSNLAFGETSELYRELVLEEQLVEFLDSDLDFHRDPGLFHVYTRVKDPEKVDRVLAEVDATVARYRDELPNAERLADLKSRIKYRFLMDLDTPSNVAGNLYQIIAVTGGIEAVEIFYQTLEGVTAEDVQQAAQKYLVTDRRTVGVLRGES